MINEQVRNLLRQIASMRDQKVSKHLARQARDLVGYESSNPQMDMIEAMKGQLILLMLRDLGGKKSYTVNEIDNDTSGKIMMMNHELTPEPKFNFYLVDKIPGEG